MSTSDVIHVSIKDAKTIKTILGKFKKISLDKPRESLVSLKEEWVMARFGPRASLRNAALQCIMDQATTDEVWADIYDHLHNVQAVIDRSPHVLAQFIANSPDATAVEWAKPIHRRLVARLKAGWTPHFTVEVLVSKAPKKTSIHKRTVVRKPEAADRFTRGFGALEGMRAGT